MDVCLNGTNFGCDDATLHPAKSVWPLPTQSIYPSDLWSDRRELTNGDGDQCLYHAVSQG